LNKIRKIKNNKNLIGINLINKKIIFAYEHKEAIIIKKVNKSLFDMGVEQIDFFY